MLKQIPTVWDDTKYLDGIPGEYIVLARRKGNDWDIGAITNNAPTVELPLFFTGNNSFNATIYKEGSTKTSIIKEQSSLTSQNTLNLVLPQGGKWTAHLQYNKTNSLKQGDANNDGKVDSMDYVIWIKNYNSTTTAGYQAGDFDSNGKVDGRDYVIWLRNYGT